MPFLAYASGVSGGAVFPPIQAAIADAVNTRVSFWICLPAFIEIALFGLWAWNKDGRKLGAAKAPVRRVQNEEEYPAAELGFRSDEKKDDETDFLEKKSDV
jgi:FHS family L-fucose permease-like MFS transporter